MLNRAENKSMTEHLSDRVRRAIEIRTAEFDLTAAEADQVGRAVVLAAEAAAKPPWRRRIAELMAPTEQEAKKLAVAIAAYDAEVLKRQDVQRKAMSAEAAARALMSDGRSDINVIERATAKVRAAAYELDDVQVGVDRASHVVGRVRGELDRAANARRRQYVENM